LLLLNEFKKDIRIGHEKLKNDIGAGRKKKLAACQEELKMDINAGQNELRKHIRV
jgi:hypothetical protein